MWLVVTDRWRRSQAARTAGRRPGRAGEHPGRIDAAAAYIERVFASPGVAAWVRDALAERDFLPFEEPYRTAPD